VSPVLPLPSHTVMQTARTLGLGASASGILLAFLTGCTGVSERRGKLLAKSELLPETASAFVGHWRTDPPGGAPVEGVDIQVTHDDGLLVSVRGNCYHFGTTRAKVFTDAEGQVCLVLGAHHVGQGSNLTFPREQFAFAGWEVAVTNDGKLSLTSISDTGPSIFQRTDLPVVLTKSDRRTQQRGRPGASQ